MRMQVDVTAGKSMTFGEFQTEVEITARHLLRLGCRRGDVIAIFSPNSFQWMMVAAAGLRVGAVFAAVNHLLKPGINHENRSSFSQLSRKRIFPLASFPRRRPVLELQARGGWDLMQKPSNSIDSSEKM